MIYVISGYGIACRNRIATCVVLVVPNIGIIYSILPTMNAAAIEGLLRTCRTPLRQHPAPVYEDSPIGEE